MEIECKENEDKVLIMCPKICAIFQFYTISFSALTIFSFECFYWFIIIWLIGVTKGF